jgi:hypothetical protein
MASFPLGGGKNYAEQDRNLFNLVIVCEPEGISALMM